MSLRGFLEQPTRERTSQVICEIEAETSVEVVVTVRKAAASYWRTQLFFGAALALVVLGVLLFSPTVYPALLIPVDTALALLLGVVMCRSVPPLRRWLTPLRWQRAAMAEAAQRAFVDLGIGRTRERTGLLLYVALFERGVLLLPDAGIDVNLLGEEYERAVQELQAAVNKSDATAFVAALAKLRRPLSQAYPRRHDDLNELENEVV
jgi:putative membrane protein